MSALLAAILSAASVQAQAPSAGVSFVGSLAWAMGQVPGDGLSLSGGARVWFSRFSAGLEAQLLPPGVKQLTAEELRRYDFLAAQTGAGRTRGVGVTGLVPLCFHERLVSACGVVVAGAVSVDSVWQPLFSYGVRLAGEYPEHSPIRARASLQALHGVVRPGGAFWSASPIQFGATLGLVVDAT
ncbi:MAG: hypothetical protein ABTQ32_39105 [Myxococcaceae bacterium]